MWTVIEQWWAGDPRRYRIGGRDLRFWFKTLPAGVLLGLFCILLSAAPARSQAEVESAAVASGGRLLLDCGDGALYPAPVTQSTRFDVQVTGPLIRVRATQRFRNDSEHWAEAVYRFPLPDGAAVRSLEMRVGERRIVGRIQEREQAESTYRAARDQGRKASLLSRQRPNVFTSRVANLGPGEEIAVVLEYSETARYRDGGFSLRLPTTITRRYTPGQEPGAVERQGLDPWTPAVQYREEGADGAPLNPARIDVALQPGVPLGAIESPYHDIVVERAGEHYSVALADGHAEMDRDFVLRWRPVASEQPRSALFTGEYGEAAFGLLMILPPHTPDTAPGNSLPREVVFVIDTSGSMAGASIRQARKGLLAGLRQLSAQDRFNVIAFNNDYRVLFARPVPATGEYRNRAEGFVRALSARGGTEMLPALRRALPLEEGVEHGAENSASAGRLRQVVWITDGAVSNERALYSAIQRRLGSSRLFTVGIGSAPNSWFMRKAAHYGRGTHTHIGNLEEVGETMGRLFARLSAPQARDLRVEWAGEAAMWPARMPDLYRGEAVIAAVRWPAGASSHSVRLSGRMRGEPWSRQLRGEPVSASGGVEIAALWARRKMESLLEERVMGMPEAQVRAAVLPLALEHSLLSPYTSFVAVEERISRPANQAQRSAVVPGTRPRGQQAGTFVYPRTATTGPARVWFGALLLCLALIVHILRRPEPDGSDAKDD